MNSPLDVSRERLCILPTPLHRLERVSEDLGQEVWIKRDDLTGFGGGGNKGRKLEYLVPEILSSGADTVVSCGGTQSNFLRQLAAACAVIGVRCVAACMDFPFLDESRRLSGVSVGRGGNLYLDKWFPIERHVYPDGTWDELDGYRDALVESETAAGRRVFKVALGGGSAEAVLAFYRAGQELADQMVERDVSFRSVVVASSSGSTQTGLAHAFAGFSTRVVGIACDPEPEIPEDLADLSLEFTKRFGAGPALAANDFTFRLDWVGPGYGVPGEAGESALAYLARREGILLDPVYSCKGFAGLLGMVRAGELKGPVCFWHTGGVPVLFGG